MFNIHYFCQITVIKHMLKLLEILFLEDNFSAWYYFFIFYWIEMFEESK